MIKTNHTFFFVGHMIQMKILFTSEQSIRLIDVAPENVTLILFLATHPDNIKRHSLARIQLFKRTKE